MACRRFAANGFPTSPDERRSRGTSSGSGSPDDGTGALPLLRHIVFNDQKSSTYKLALLRTLVRIADSAGGFARPGS